MLGHLLCTTSSFVYHFKSIGEFKLKLQSRNAQFGVKIGDFLPHVPWKFDEWSWKTIGHLFYTTSRFVHKFKFISEVKLKLQSGNAQFGSKSVIFFLYDLECDRWPWKTIGPLFYTTSSFVHNFKAMGEFKLELQSGNAQFRSKSVIFFTVWP